jgi:hypothetical protein
MFDEYDTGMARSGKDGDECRQEGSAMTNGDLIELTVDLNVRDDGGDVVVILIARLRMYALWSVDAVRV